MTDELSAAVIDDNDVRCLALHGMRDWAVSYVQAWFGLHVEMVERCCSALVDVAYIGFYFLAMRIPH